MDCIFCKIINNEIPSYKIYENDNVFAFLDIQPASEGHCIVIPKKHFKNFSECDDNYLKEVAIAKKQIVQILKDKLNPQGFNYLSNQEAIAGQSVFHYHEHIIPKYKENEGFILSANKVETKDVKSVYESLK
ncbi:Histidine triad protein [Mycoplasma yeatsii 13926]|uniref:Histidine triad protein n=1 Tax=Mycoplasma yeatsii 13926 TaxID=1188240 RepID=S6G3C5_9MOLU|nr:HIT family protein [Mycoplasma yeatsii]EOA06961.1 Histidine triad protein [Mycoplasma yeatsii 13926]